MELNKEKQINEMAKAIFMNCHCGLFEDEAKMIAKWCYQEIDRKVEEIFEEIEEARRQYIHGKIDENQLIVRLYQIKKKYAESENNDG